MEVRREQRRDGEDARSEDTGGSRFLRHPRLAAIQQAPWSLRFYLGLNVAVAILLALTTGDEQSWTAVFWAAVFGIAICEGSRVIWWWLIVVNVVALFVIPMFFSVSWLSIPLSLIGLALLLAPESRRYVFDRDPEPGHEVSEG